MQSLHRTYSKILGTIKSFVADACQPMPAAIHIQINGLDAESWLEQLVEAACTKCLKKLDLAQRAATADPAPPVSDAPESIVEEQLSVLKGKNLEGNKIMSDADYKRMIGYTQLLISNKSVPQEIQSIDRVLVRNEFLLHTFYQLHKKIFGRNIQRYWIAFLKSLFDTFKDTEERSMYKNWSQYRSATSYEKEVERMKRKTQSPKG